MIRAACLLLACGVAGAAAAQAPAPTPAWTVDGMAQVVSDYRYRGVSVSDRKPALQAELTATHRSGAYGDLFLSTIDEYGAGDDGEGAKVEATLTGGWAGAVHGLDVDISVAAYLYPNGHDVSYVEFPAQVGRTVGPVTWIVGGAYAPAQSALYHKDDGYVWGEFDYAFAHPQVQAFGAMGYESGAYAPGGRTDWSLGVRTSFHRLQLGLSVVDSNRDPAALVGRLGVAF